MRRTGFKGLVATGLVAASVAASTTAVSAQDMFLKIADMPGESQDEKHKGEIDVLSWSWGHVTGTGKTGKDGLPQTCIQDMSVTKFIDKATVDLIMASVKGELIPEAILSVQRSGENRPQEYLTLKLRDVYVTSYQTGGAAAQGASLTENLVLHFESVKFEYRAQRQDGQLEPAVSGEFALGKCEK